MVDDISGLTRKVYESQHEMYATDEDAYQRLYDIYNNASWPISKEWFKGKKALDAGCGNAGYLILWLFHQGIANVYGIDIGNEWIEKLKLNLTKRGISQSKLKLQPGSLLNIPFEDNYFDFVSINGVLIHLNNVQEIKDAFKEGARVLKQGGYYYTTYGVSGGLITDAVLPAIQKYYNDNIYFKELIDNISPKKIHDIFDFIVKEHLQQTGEHIEPEHIKTIKSLFGVDYCVFLQNFIQRPTDFSSICTPEFVESLYEKNGFHSIVRQSHYVKRKDIRKFLAPLHYSKNELISKAFYDRGAVDFIGVKK